MMEIRKRRRFQSEVDYAQFTVMPFRLCNAPATFECLMEQVLSGLPLSIALVYLDDVLVPARTLLIKFLISNKFFGGSGRCI